MGSTQSKIENKEAVNQCKKRKQHMGDVIAARNAFAFALSAFAVALENTGGALNNYAACEVQHHQSCPGGPSGAGASAAAAQLPIETFPPPPRPLQHAATMPEMSEIPKAESRPVGLMIEEEEEEEENELENDESSILRQRSSSGTRDIRNGGGGGSRGSGSRKEAVAENEAPTQRGTSPQRTQPESHKCFFAPMENIPAPTMGEEAAEEVRVDKKHVECKVFSEKLKRVEDDGEVAAPVVSEKALEPPVSAAAEVALAAKSAKKGKAGMTPDGERVANVDISLRQIFLELGGHFRKASKSAHDVSKMLEVPRLHYPSNFADNRGRINLSKRMMCVIPWNRSFRRLPNADDVKDDFDSEENETHAKVSAESLAGENEPYDQVKVESKVFSERPKRVEDDGDVAASVVAGKALEPSVLAAVEVAPAAKSAKKGKAGMMLDAKWVAKADIRLKWKFLGLGFKRILGGHLQKASKSAHEKKLKMNGLHHHLNFADNLGLPNADDVKDDFDSENEIHATVLDELLSWENKLFDDVKAVELLKYEYERKVAALKQGDHSEYLEKTEAAVIKLQTGIRVNADCVNFSISKINSLRDRQLYPEIIQLVDGMAKMWEAMRICHESQHESVKNLAYLEINQATKETGEHHHDSTLQLFKVVVDWHEQFKNVVDNQKKFIEALKNWLKQNVIPIETSFRERVSSPPWNDNPLIQIVHAWEENLKKLPDEPATAINKIREVFDAIMRDQEEEMKFKEKYEETRREITRKKRSLTQWQRRAPSDDQHIAKKQAVVTMLVKRLAEEEDAHRRQCLQVREKTLVSFKNHLPEPFGALSTFAIASSVMYGKLRSLSQP